MANPPLSPITPAPPPRKKGGCGCFGTGCIIVLALLLIAGGVGLFIGYRLVEYVKGFTSDQGIEIAIVEGTDEEYAAVEKKVKAFDAAYSAGQSSAMQLTAREINVLIARDPGFAGAKGKVAVSIEDGILGGRLSLPLDIVPVVNAVPQLKGRYFNGDVKLRFTVEDGTARLDIQEMKGGNNVMPPDLVKQLSDEWTKVINTDPDYQEGLSRTRKVAAEGDVLIIETKPGPGAVPESATPASTPSENPEAP